MNASADVSVSASGPGRMSARGPLTFATAPQARAAGLTVMGALTEKDVEIDCGEVSESDSAGLAVLLDWLAAARRRNMQARFVNLPERLIALARISEIEGALGVSG